MIRASAIALVFTLALGSSLTAQSFQPRSTRPVGNERASTPAQVSQDLLNIYAQTKSAHTESAVTAIARACSQVIPDPARTKLDRDYAASLLSWALNRRGEMRSEQAAKLVEQGQLPAAAKLDQLAAADFETAIEYGPSNWRVHHNLAIALAMKEDYQRAIEQFTSSIELKPDYPNAHFNRGELYMELGQLAEALRDYSAAIDLNNKDPQYYNSRGHCEFMLESFEDALDDYRRAAELATDSAVYQTDLADAHQYLGQWEAAASAYRAAVAINNKFPRAFQNAAWLMATCPDPKLQNVELALSAAKKAIELEGGRTAHNLDTLAAATAAAGRHAEAAKLQQQALELSTDQAERLEFSQRLALYQQGRSYVQPRALASLDKAADMQVRKASATTTASTAASGSGSPSR